MDDKKALSYKEDERAQLEEISLTVKPAGNIDDLFGSKGDLLEGGQADAQDLHMKDEQKPGEKPDVSVRSRGRSMSQKSELMRLCEDFLHKFGHIDSEGKSAPIFLNVAAAQCHVPRRRLYDVINVLEAVNVVRRMARLQYEFKGYEHLPELFVKLASATPNPGSDDHLIEKTQTASSKRAANSLYVLSRKLLREMLLSDGILRLTTAAAALLGPGVEIAEAGKNRSQTQITVERRLYDIGSIFCTIGILAKVHLADRQPAFEWTYGWKPGDTHLPPVLDAQLRALEPPPVLPELTAEAYQAVKPKPHTKRKRPKESNDGHPEVNVNMNSQQYMPMAGWNPHLGPASMPPLDPSEIEKLTANALFHPSLLGHMSIPNLQAACFPMLGPDQKFEDLSAVDPAALAAILAGQGLDPSGPFPPPGQDINQHEHEIMKMMQMLPLMMQLPPGMPPYPMPDQAQQPHDAVAGQKQVEDDDDEIDIVK
jgi:hypothetical protein